MRIRFIDVECEGPAVAEALRTFSGMLLGGPRATVQVEQVKALVAPAEVIREPKKATRETRPRKAAVKTKAADVPGRPSACSIILERLKTGPKTLGEITEYVQMNGRPDYTRVQCSATLSYLHKQGRCKLNDGLWSA
jgi:hypothetical protein